MSRRRAVTHRRPAAGGRRHRRTAGLLRLAVVLSAALALWPVARAPASSYACVPTLHVDGVQETAIGPRPDFERAGTVPAYLALCPGGGDESVTANRLRGVPPEVGVGYGGQVHVAVGQLYALPGHPLFRRGTTGGVRPCASRRRAAAVTCGRTS